MVRRHLDNEGRAESAGPLFASAEAQVARDRRDLGILRAASRADRVDSDWRAGALTALREYARTHQHFLLEDVRKTFTTPSGVDGRAWGSVIKEAQRSGIVAMDGTAPANSSNRSPKCRWKSLVFEGSKTT